jgi:hypothetical protein
MLKQECNQICEPCMGKFEEGTPGVPYSETEGEGRPIRWFVSSLATCKCVP